MGSMNLVEKNTIYLCNYGNCDEIVWVGENNYNGNFIDKHYTGQYYTGEQVSMYFKGTISLEDAVSRNLIKYSHFERMGKLDKTNTIKAMLKLKGLPETLNFLSKTNLGLSAKDIESLTNFN